MHRLSSNLTLFFKIFLPVSWASFFGLFGFVIFMLEPMDEPFLTSTTFRLIYVLAFVLFLTLIYFTIFQLKRVETDGQDMYVTDYFKTVRFPIANIKRISTLNLGLLNVARLHLHQSGYFGSKIPMITTRAYFSEFRRQYPELFDAQH